MWFIGVEVEQETSAPPPKKILDPPLKRYPLDSDLSGGWRYTFEQPWPGQYFRNGIFHMSKLFVVSFPVERPKKLLVSNGKHS